MRSPVLRGRPQGQTEAFGRDRLAALARPARGPLNGLGYELLADDVELAVAVFELNVHLFPGFNGPAARGVVNGRLVERNSERNESGNGSGNLHAG